MTSTYQQRELSKVAERMPHGVATGTHKRMEDTQCLPLERDAESTAQDMSREPLQPVAIRSGEQEELVSLHSIYCDCPRCTEVRKVEKEKKYV